MASPFSKRNFDICPERHELFYSLEMNFLLFTNELTQFSVVHKQWHNGKKRVLAYTRVNGRRVKQNEKREEKKKREREIRFVFCSRCHHNRSNNTVNIAMFDPIAIRVIRRYVYALARRTGVKRFFTIVLLFAVFFQFSFNTNANKNPTKLHKKSSTFDNSTMFTFANTIFAILPLCRLF